MKLTRFTHNYAKESGFTVLEVLVSSALGLIITFMCANTAIVQKELFTRDSARTTLNQDLRGASDVLISDGRVAGENLTESFPAVELIKDKNGKQELVLRRNLLSSVLNVCTSLNAGASRSKIYIANSNTKSGCIRNDEKTKYNIWKNYRAAHKDSSNTVKAYIFNSGTKKGEFINYNNEGITSNNYWISGGSGTFKNSYPAGSSWILILEEWRYRLNDEDMLQVIVDGDEDEPFNLAFGVKSFNTVITDMDDIDYTSFTTDDDWTNIYQIETTITGEERAGKNNVTKSIVAHFFPRNVLSH